MLVFIYFSSFFIIVAGKQYAFLGKQLKTLIPFNMNAANDKFVHKFNINIDKMTEKWRKSSLKQNKKKKKKENITLLLQSFKIIFK